MVKSTIEKKYINVKNKINNFTNETIMKKKGGNELLITSIVLIGIGIVLCLLYKEKVVTFLTEAMNSLTEKWKLITT